jgi:hypothetical protein
MVIAMRCIKVTESIAPQALGGVRTPALQDLIITIKPRLGVINVWVWRKPWERHEWTGCPFP